MNPLYIVYMYYILSEYALANHKDAYFYVNHKDACFYARHKSTAGLLILFL